jgi:SAM-dependent methyltransferase
MKVVLSFFQQMSQKLSLPEDIERPPMLFKALTSFVVFLPIWYSPWLSVKVAVISAFALYVYPVHHRYMHLIIPFIMKRLDIAMKEVRLQLLEEVTGDVLDVGCATGLYLKYYANNTKVTSVLALEPDTLMHEELSKTMSKSCPNIGAKITARKVDKEFAKQYESKFDSVILGNVLCEVDDLSQTLICLKKILKPKGKIFFCEHVLDQDQEFVSILQRLLNGWWRRVSGGCNCNRPTLTIMKTMFHVNHKSYYIGTPLVSRMEVGIAVKPG